MKRSEIATLVRKVTKKHGRRRTESIVQEWLQDENRRVCRTRLQRTRAPRGASLRSSPVACALMVALAGGLAPRRSSRAATA